MSSSLRWFAGPVVLLLFSVQLLTDAGPPCLLMWSRRDSRVPQQPIAVPEYDFVIVSDPNIKEAELRIPRRLLVADASIGATS